MSAVTIVDLGLGNLDSVARGFARAGVEARLVSGAADIRAARRLVLPGVGAFGAAAAALDGEGLREAIRDAAARGVPLLGICLGMQLLFARSEEGEGEGLGLLDGNVARLEGARVPNMGWCPVLPRRASPLLPASAWFYFAHSFAVRPARAEDVAADAGRDGEAVPALVGRANVWGAQFHPEKSQRAGLELLRAFGRMEISS